MSNQSFLLMPATAQGSKCFKVHVLRYILSFKKWEPGVAQLMSNPSHLAAYGFILGYAVLFPCLWALSCVPAPLAGLPKRKKKKKALWSSYINVSNFIDWSSSLIVTGIFRVQDLVASIFMENTNAGTCGGGVWCSFRLMSAWP